LPITYHIDSDAGIVQVVVQGSLVLEEMLATIAAVAEDPLFQKGLHVLSDHRTIAAPATTDQVMGLIQQARKFQEKLGGTRWAIVVSSDLSFGMMRMLSAFAEPIPLRVEVFREYEEALAWLRDAGSTPVGGNPSS